VSKKQDILDLQEQVKDLNQQTSKLRDSLALLASLLISLDPDLGKVFLEELARKKFNETPLKY
jgi:hypothetical protein